MTATLPELMFSAFFVMLMNTLAIFACLTEREGIGVMRAIATVIDRSVIKGLPLKRNEQTASQPEPIRSVRSQPAVRIAS
jgi:hypothetical protein